MLDICLLGCGGTLPSAHRYLTSMLASSNGRMLLIDCGEGTQVSMKLLGWGFKYIDVICITHYHADHIVGLPGLLLTIANSGRTEPLIILGPTGLKEVIKGLSVLFPNLPYEIRLVEIEDAEFKTQAISEFIINTITVEHTVPCLSYALEIKRGRKFSRQKAEEQGIPMKFWNHLQKGHTIVYEDRELLPDMVLEEERKGIKACYVTDTRPIDKIIEFIKGAELFICEGMYGEDENLPKALENKHMLFSEAAYLAKEGNVKELWLTHFGPALTNPEEYLHNAEVIFHNSKLGRDRMTTELFFSK